MEQVDFHSCTFLYADVHRYLKTLNDTGNVNMVEAEMIEITRSCFY